MSRRNLEIAMANMDIIATRSSNLCAMFQAVLQEGGKRPKLTSDEREKILADVDAIQQDLEEVLEIVEKDGPR